MDANEFGWITEDTYIGFRVWEGLSLVLARFVDSEFANMTQADEQGTTRDILSWPLLGVIYFAQVMI